MSSTVLIYGLIDPQTNECRYVGKAKDLIQRLKDHCKSSSLRAHTHKNSWIKSVLSDGHQPEIVAFERAPEHEWEEAESFWIAYFKMLGAKLTNGSLGGEGGNVGAAGHRKQAAALRGRKRQFSPEHLAKIVKANRDRVRDPIWRERIRAAARRRFLRDPGHIARASQAAIGAPRTALYQLKCLECGAAFETTTRKSRYCSRACGISAWKQGKRVEYS